MRAIILLFLTCVLFQLASAQVNPAYQCPGKEADCIMIGGAPCYTSIGPGCTGSYQEFGGVTQYWAWISDQCYCPYTETQQPQQAQSSCPAGSGSDCIDCSGVACMNTYDASVCQGHEYVQNGQTYYLNWLGGSEGCTCYCPYSLLQAKQQQSQQPPQPPSQPPSQQQGNQQQGTQQADKCPHALYCPNKCEIDPSDAALDEAFGIFNPDKTLFSYAGQCDPSTGQCAYKSVTCKDGCTDSGCNNAADYCSKHTCADKCVGDAYYSGGNCNPQIGACEYTQTKCQYGCDPDTGRCVDGTKCASKTCGDYCDGDTLMVNGDCDPETGKCFYSPVKCDNGCDSGAKKCVGAAGLCKAATCGDVCMDNDFSPVGAAATLGTSGPCDPQTGKCEYAYSECPMACDSSRTKCGPLFDCSSIVCESYCENDVSFTGGSCDPSKGCQYAEQKCDYGCNAKTGACFQAPGQCNVVGKIVLMEGGAILKHADDTIAIAKEKMDYCIGDEIKTMGGSSMVRILFNDGSVREVGDSSTYVAKLSGKEQKSATERIKGKIYMRGGNVVDTSGGPDVILDADDVKSFEEAEIFSDVLFVYDNASHRVTVLDGKAIISNPGKNLSVTLTSGEQYLGSPGQVVSKGKVANVDLSTFQKPDLSSQAQEGLCGPSMVLLALLPLCVLSICRRTG